LSKFSVGWGCASGNKTLPGVLGVMSPISTPLEWSWGLHSGACGV